MRRRSLYIATLITTAIIILGFRFLDENFLEQLKSKLSEFNKRYPDERVYLQFDKTMFKPGEDVWFKAYLLNGTNMAPSLISSVVYVELVDPRGTVIKKLDLYADDGTAHGDFALSQELAGGLYTIRAFTRWMQNFPEDTYFTKEITVQSVITPRLLLKIDFEKQAYGKNDIVTAPLKVRDLKDQPVANAEIKATLKLDGNDYQSKTLQTNNDGEADIAFQLPADLKTTDGLLQVLVSTAGIEESISRSIPIVLNKIQLRFFPEGGDVIARSNGRIAIEALDEFGKGADVAGIIVDETGNKVADFESYHMGMGAFNLPGTAGHRYTARITRPLGIDDAFELPEVKSEGFSLSIQPEGDSIIIAKVFSPTAAQAYLVGHVHGLVETAERLSLHSGWNETRIGTKAMPVGIATFTLFNGDGVESCERLIFVNRKKTLHIDLTTHRKEYLPGEKVELTVKTSDQSGTPVRANLSVAVVDDQLLSYADDKQDNILSWLLLGSELKGKIEKPNFYFDEDEPKAEAATDYLLMIHGWRRFTWKEVFAPNQTLAYMPENERNLNGFVLDSKNKGTPAEVVLMELSNRKRIAKVKADKNGQFLFKNIDASSAMLLLTKKPRLLEVNGLRSTSNESYQYYKDNTRRYRINPVIEIDDQVSNTDVPLKVPSPPSNDTDSELTMSEDVSQLSEVVVVGYGVSEERRNLSGSVVTIRDLHTASITASPLEQALAGRVSGITITQGAQPGPSANLQIRGVGSLSNQGEPLWVIDGVPFARSINSNFPMGSQLAPGNIKSITVIKGSDATALYGYMAGNGVIIVETKTNADNATFQYVRKKPRYSVMTIAPRTFSQVREFYSDPTTSKETRKNFNTTVFWKHTLVTDSRGEAKLEFKNNDNVSTFRIVAEGFSGSGLIGRKETTYHTLLPFALDTRVPNYLGFEDTLRLPIRITNNTKDRLEAKLSVNISAQLRSNDKLNQTVEVGANQTVTVPVSIIPSGVAGTFPITVALEANNRKDKISQMIEVHPVGFPVHASFAGHGLNHTTTIRMKDIEKGSVKGQITLVTNVLDELFAGAEAMLREPHGCFEQVSSSTFPNILALQYLRKTGQTNPAIEQKATKFIQSGYKQLAAYEIKSGGFEWFGNPPAHEALTAFGLIEFTEMKKVFAGVDPAMIERTKNWLLSRRSGHGMFQQNHGKYGFSEAPYEVNNAYIVYALSETGVAGIEPEYNHSLENANSTQDMYLAALMANAAINFGKTADFKTLKDSFVKSVRTDGFDNLKMQSSVTYSYGNSLANETVALWALALMKESNPDYRLIRSCLEFIGSKKSGYMYGSTQATYLSLKAITEFHNLDQAKRSDGSVLVTVNEGNAADKSYSKETRDNILISNFADQLKEGDNKISIAFTNTTEALPYSVDLTWNSKTPPGSENCKLKIETRLTKSQVKVNETVRLSIKLINTSRSGVPMSMAVVGIPAGLSLQPWQLKELKEKGVFDFYEIIDDKLALYYRELGPAEIKEIKLDLKADLPGTFLASASSAYLYYTNEFKHWTEGMKVTIE
jgi:TonB-dependent SusC/RagA subfamily outer membrane receptor